jgi:glutamate N-acetyltransferase/amino-acid N-acetyltransferase
MPIIRVPGFRFAGVACGIKKRKKDLALIVSEQPANAAALFTTNQVKAAPVIVGQEGIKKGTLQAVVANSGNANACTGARGLRDAKTMCREAGMALGIDPGLVLPSSTGVIGVALPLDKVKSGIEQAAGALSPGNFADAAEAILTTDKFPKVAIARGRIDGKTITVAGMTKGAGMIAPNMATMLAYVLTDAAVEAGCLRRVLGSSTEETFNRITVDGDMSTNDTVLLMANGSAGNRLIKSGSPECDRFEDMVRQVMKKLALKLVEDGEGSTKVAEVRVEKARSVDAAKKIAFTVANSKLVKTAFYGADPNFGRIVAAVGYSGEPIDPGSIDVYINRIRVVTKGMGTFSREAEASRMMRRPTFVVRIVLNQGHASASVWTSDLNHEYIRINSAYRS